MEEAHLILKSRAERGKRCTEHSKQGLLLIRGGRNLGSGQRTFWQVDHGGDDAVELPTSRGRHQVERAVSGSPTLEWLL